MYFFSYFMAWDLLLAFSNYIKISPLQLLIRWDNNPWEGLI